MDVGRTSVDSLVELAADIAGRADEIDDILVLYRIKNSDRAYALDNGMTVADAVLLCEQFKAWILACMSKQKD